MSGLAYVVVQMQEDHRRKLQRRRVALNLNKNVITPNGIVLLPI